VSQVSITSAALWFAAALTGTNTFAEARQTPDPLTSLPLEQLMQFEVDSVSKYPQKTAEAPAAISIVTAQDIKAYGYRTLAEILNSMRGLYVSSDRNYTYLGARGFSVPGDYNTRMLLLVDGVRYNDDIYDQAPIGSDFTIDVDLIDRVEFIAGPASAVYGSNALLGVINIVTKSGGNFLGANAAGDIGSYNTTHGRFTAGNADANGASWLLSASRLNQQGQNLYYPEFDTPDQNHGIAQHADYNRVTTLFGKYKNGGLTLTLTHGDTTKGIPTASFGQTFNDNRSQTVDTRTNYGLEYQRPLTSTLSALGRLYGGHYEYRGNYIYDDSLLENRDISRGDWMGGEAQLIISALQRQKIVTGVEYRYAPRVDQKNFDVTPRVDYLDDKRSSSVASMYVQDAITLTDQFILNLGNRLDRTHSYDWTNNPRVGLIYQPDHDTSLKLLYSSAYRTPNAYELYYYHAFDNANDTIELKSERIHSREFIVEHEYGPGERVSLSLFRNDIDNLIALRTDPNSGALNFINDMGADTEGLEMEWQSVLANGARLKASYSWQRMNDHGANRLINSPHNVAKFNAAGMLHGALGYGIDARAVSARDTFNAHTPGYAVIDFTLRYEINDQLELAGTLYNAFDHRYYDPGSAEHTQDVLMQDERNFRIKMDYWF